MSIKIDTSITEVFDPQDPTTMRQFCVAVKQYLEELSRKAQSSQMEIRDTAPGVNDIEEGEQVRATVGGLNYIYTKKDGQVLRWQIS